MDNDQLKQTNQTSHQYKHQHQPQSQSQSQSQSQHQQKQEQYKNHSSKILKEISRKAMIERELLPEFSSELLEELLQIVTIFESSSKEIDTSLIDLRHLPWCSIDNDDSKDLDQLTYAQIQKEDKEVIKILVAIADVDALVKKGSHIDDHAVKNTTSVYTAGEIFPLLPPKLSNDLTSLNLNQDRMSLVIDMNIDMNILHEGKIKSSNIYQAIVKNHAKLTYNSVGTWLEGKGEIPDEILNVKNLSRNIILQDKVAQVLRKNRHEHGALDLLTIQARPIFHNDKFKNLEVDTKNRAKELIEDFMVAANTVTARFLKSKRYPSLRRVVRQPERWDKIVEVAAQYGHELPFTPNSYALSVFLKKQKIADPLRFPDLSLTIIKLLGKGEYIVEFPGDIEIGHFGLAVMDYTHSTAPNRRFPDLITQRMLKAALKGMNFAYSNDELIQLAQHCTKKEDDANKVERRVSKSAGALLLSSRIGETFDALCTGAADKGTWVRIFNPPVEGRLIYGFAEVDVGHRLRVELIHTNVEKGFIDFKRI
ncbi:MAG: RNB domain-containing ribonuclease [Oligoflexia bacterium]|nr:RNB domain-containing ribonuclease [Oligoflexia bacterium]